MNSINIGDDADCINHQAQVFAVGPNSAWANGAGYVAAGRGLRNQATGTITLAGVPAGSTIRKALLYWNILGYSNPGGAIAINGVARTGTLVKQGATPCWLPSASWAFRADVTAQVTGNGTYVLSGHPSANTSGQAPWGGDVTSSPMAEGASLLVFYEVPTSPPSAALPPEQTFGVNCEPLEAGGTLARAPCGEYSEPVHTLTGAFVHAETDLTLASTGLPFEWRRTYTSADTASGRFGQGWTDTYQASLEVQPNGDVIAKGDEGQRLRFTSLGGGSFDGAAGARATLTTIAGGYRLTTNGQLVYEFDTAGKLLSKKDRNGQGVTLAYDGSGRLQTVSDSAGRTATVSYNASNLVSGVALSDGRSVSYGYTSGRLTAFTDVRGKQWQYTYDAGGRLATIVDPLNHTQVTNVYDPATGRVTSQTDATNKTTQFTWDAATQIATVTDPNGHVWKDVYVNNLLFKRIDGTNKTTEFGFDSDLNGTSVKSPLGETTAMSYDGNGNLLTATAPPSLNSATKTFVYNTRNDPTTVTDARGKVTTYAYDPAGNNTGVTQDGATVATYTFDAAGRVLTFKDGNDKTTVYTYDSAGNVASVTDPLGNKTTYTYDASGRVLTRVEPKGNVAGGTPSDFTWTYTYNPAGQVLTEADPLGNTTTYTYDDAGNRASVTDANGKMTSFAFDAANRLLNKTAPDTGVTEFTYDAAGNKLTEKNPRGTVTTYTYDDANRLASATTPSGTKTTHFYDANGNLIRTVAPRGNAAGANPDDFDTLYTYDAAGRLLTETDPLGNVTTHVYDAVGNEVSLTDARGNTTGNEYDGRNRLVRVTAPSPPGGVTEYTYDNVGNRLTEKDERGFVTTYAYDGAGRLISVTGPDPDGPGLQGPSVTTYSYDANGNQTATVEPRGNTSGANPNDYKTVSTFDRVNRRTSETDPLGNQATWSYDAAGNTLSVKDANDHTTTYTYDAVNRLKTVTAPDLGVTTYTHDLAGNLVSRRDARNNVTSFGYDDDNRRVSVTSPLSQLWTTAYDPDGNVAQTVDANGNATTTAGDGTTAFTYDRAGRLTGIDYSDTTPDVSYTYDALGNRTQMTDGLGSETRTHDKLNRLTAVTRGTESFSYLYDLAGNVTRRTYGDGRFYDYVYDNAGRMASVTENGVTSTRVDYGYDVAGNQLSKVLPSTNGYTEARTIDRAGRLTDVRHTRSTAVTATQTLPPTTTPEKSNLNGTVADIDESPDNPDAAWMTATSNGANVALRVTFDTPPYVLAGAQTFRALVRKRGGSATPTARLDVYESGQLVATGSTVNVTSTSGQIVSQTFDADALPLVDRTGAHVELRLVGTSAGTGGARAAVDVGAVEWRALYASKPQTLARFTYTLDGVGNPSQVVGLEGTTRYLYDVNDRLTEECRQATVCTIASSPFIRWTYDNVGNRLTEARPSGTTSYSYDAGDRLLSATGLGSFTYDANGNQLSGRGMTLGYDLANRMSSVRQGGGLAAVTTTYTYDGDGVRRLAVYRDPPDPSNPNDVTRTWDYGWDVLNPVPLLTRERFEQVTTSNPPPGGRLPAVDGVTISSLSYGTGFVREVVSGAGGNGTVFAHQDRLGSVAATSALDGTIDTGYRYEPYGTTRQDIAFAAAALGTSLRFTGEYVDPTGLYHLRARQYDTVTGRFTSFDPLDQRNRLRAVSAYAYVDDRPTMFIDPTGMTLRPANLALMATRGPASPTRTTEWIALWRERAGFYQALVEFKVTGDFELDLLGWSLNRDGEFALGLGPGLWIRDMRGLRELIRWAGIRNQGLDRGYPEWMFASVYTDYVYVGAREGQLGAPGGPSPYVSRHQSMSLTSNGRTGLVQAIGRSVPVAKLPDWGFRVTTQPVAAKNPVPSSARFILGPFIFATLTVDTWWQPFQPDEIPNTNGRLDPCRYGGRFPCR